jgi:hypothetical protein
MGSGMIANPGISVNPNQSPNDNARYLFMVDLLIELQPKSARSQSGLTLFRCLSPTIAIEGRVPAARLHHANSAGILLYGILATTSIHPTLAPSAVAQLWQHVRSESDLKEFTPTVSARFERTRSSTPP